MAVDVILGLQWGDEGKGKIVDYLADKYDLVCRFQGGPNAGHTIIINDRKFVLHTIPSGIFRQNILNVIGNGVVIDPITLNAEIQKLQNLNIDFKKSLRIAKKAHLILPTHRYLDAASEMAKGKNKIGSTLRGIGPTYMDKTGRNGLRIGDIESPDFLNKYKNLKKKHLRLALQYPSIDFDLENEEKKWLKSIEFIKAIPFADAEFLLNKAIQQGKKILAEGAQGSMLDIDFGTYPFVTSSNTISSGVCSGLGIAPNKIREVIGISKAYCTRVGSGPFPTELHNKEGEKLREQGHEFGATTGRPRRCGWIDLVQLKYTIMINGVSQLTLTKLDVLNNFEEIKYARKYRNKLTGEYYTELPFDLADPNLVPVFETMKAWNCDLSNSHSYDELPPQAKKYISFLEKELEIPINIISIGPERKELIVKEMANLIY